MIRRLRKDTIREHHGKKWAEQGGAVRNCGKAAPPNDPRLRNSTDYGFYFMQRDFLHILAIVELLRTLCIDESKREKIRAVA